ncbi:MAG: endonuclease MutS2 [Acidaminococcaceae bacterium]|nr:endonuclease MutS2 [Acidaminococcaceae bacterium]MDD4721225.1 endonuclease MutS2 [Acidaminococcaceae bacterium]
MAKFAVKTLEFFKIKDALAQETSTSLGKNLALELRSENEFAVVKKMLEETAEALRLQESGRRFPFGGAVDITEGTKRAKVGAVLDIETLMSIANTAASMRQIKNFLLEFAQQAPNLSVYANAMQEFPRLEKQLNSAISEKGEIKDSASTKLAGLRTGILVAKRRVKEKLDSILHSAENQKYFQDQLVTMREDRYVIPIKQEYKFNFPGVVHDQSGSGATLFIEPLAVVNLNNDIKKYISEEKEEVERILRQLSASVALESDQLDTTLKVLAKLDLICAKAYLAKKQKAQRPMLLLQNKIEIVQGKHPLLDPEKAVPLDINLGDGFNSLLITGPNTGGKTVALKTVGLFALMAQAGMFVPAHVAKLPVFGGVYADIGDEQSIEQSLSTFSGHLKNMVSILQEANSGDLVLVDEICVGTDPTEGAALAMAMLDYLHGKKVMTIITTHYSELKTFAYEHDGMENASVEFDPVSLQPTYKLLMGVPGSSNAFYISKRLGLPESILAQAESLIGQEHANMENVLQNLEGERRQYQRRNSEIENLRLEAERLKTDLMKKKLDLDKRRNETLRKAREEADALYRNSRKESSAILKELRAMKNLVDTAKVEELAEMARKGLNKSFALEGKPVPEGQGLAAGNAAVGKKVYLKTLGQSGVIAEINGAQVIVQVGVMRTTVAMKNCLLLPEGSQAAKPKQSTMRRVPNQRHDMFVKKAQTTTTEIDVRGKTVDEAIPYVDKAIDDALLSGMEHFRLIHGKGTGMLRVGLTEYLKKHSAVRRIEMAPNNEGGAGATIVYL